MMWVPPKARPIWTTLEEGALLDFLSEKKHEMTLGGLFKDVVLKQAASATREYHERGVEKNVNSCKSKWRNACISFVHALSVS
jgi:hypothetical protein